MMDTYTLFFIYTVVAGSLFAYALLWVIAMWLKAGEEEEAVERETRKTVERLRAAGCVNLRPGCCPEYDKAMLAEL